MPLERWVVVDTDQNWYRQLAALVLLSGSRAAVEFITNPGARSDATAQLKGALADIDYDALAGAVTRAIDDVASSSKDRLSGTIDTLRDRSIDVVGDAKTRAEKQLGAKKGGKKMRFFFGLLIGGLIAYFIFDEQRRDDLLDKLTGASGPIQQTVPNVTHQAADTVHHAADTVHHAADTVQQAAEKTAEKADKAADKAAEKAAEKA
jgi:methyl-accepting chemotaxis protein